MRFRYSGMTAPTEFADAIPLPRPHSTPLGTRPSFTDTHDRWPVHECVAYLLAQEVTGQLRLEPQGLTLHLNRGRVDAVQGGVRLGTVLTDEGLVPAEAITAALASGQLLGQALLRTRILTALQLRGALRIQIRRSLTAVMAAPPERYTFTPGLPLPVPSAGLPGGEVMAQLLNGRDALPLGSVFQVAALAQAVTVEPEVWALLRWANGRRTLRRMIELSGLAPDAAHSAVRALFGQGLVEPSAMTGLKFIVPRVKPASNVRQPPSGIRGNLFIKHLDGQQDVWSVTAKLNFPQEEAASLLTALYRDDLLEILHGQPEFQRLLEQY